MLTNILNWLYRDRMNLKAFRLTLKEGQRIKTKTGFEYSVYSIKGDTVKVYNPRHQVYQYFSTSEIYPL